MLTATAAVRGRGAVKILDAYIARRVAAGALLALAVLLSLTAVVSLIEELDSVGRGRYALDDAIEFVLLTLPRHAFVLFPFAAVIGALVGLGTLAVSSELTVVRASGVSVGRIVVAVLKGALALMVVAVLLGEVVAPWCERHAQTRRAAALDESHGWGDGYWIRDGRHFVNVSRVRPDGRVEDMYIYELDTRGALRTVTHARRGRYRDGAWMLDSVRRSEVSADGVVTRFAPSTVWRARFGPDLVKLATARLESLSGRALVRYIAYLRENRLDTAAYELALGMKVVYPIATGVMIVLAVPLVLGRLGGAAFGNRILAGCLIAVAFHIVNEVFGTLGIVYGFNPVLSASVPTLSFLAAGVWLLWRVR